MTWRRSETSRSERPRDEPLSCGTVSNTLSSCIFEVRISINHMHGTRPLSRHHKRRLRSDRTLACRLSGAFTIHQRTSTSSTRIHSGVLGSHIWGSVSLRKTLLRPHYCAHGYRCGDNMHSTSIRARRLALSIPLARIGKYLTTLGRRWRRNS
jgi:hypothetical protein